MTIATLNSHISAAVNMLNQRDQAFVAIGRPKPWVDDSNPPIEDKEVDSLSEVIGYKKVRQFSVARPVASGEDSSTLGFPVVTYRGTEWVLIPTSKAFEEKARYVYVETTIEPTDLPPGPFRQSGIHFNLKPRTGIQKQNLLPSEVQDAGVLQLYENSPPQVRTDSVSVVLQFMIKL